MIPLAARRSPQTAGRSAAVARPPARPPCRTAIIVMSSSALDRVALVTGGTRGIGFGIASKLAQNGYNLVLGYNSNAEAAAAAQQQLQQQFGVQVEVVGGDATLPATWDAIFDCVQQQFGGRLTAFVHNAGLYIGITSVSDAQPKVSGDADWEAAYDYYQAIYVKGFRRGLAKALECEGLRHVVTISSPGCNCNNGPRLGYEAPGQAKAGLEFLTRRNALALAGRGINVNCIVPGFIRTEAWSHLPKASARLRGESASAAEQPSAEDRLAKIIAETPAQRWGSPEEIGEVAAFLCSDRAAFLTGATIPVDGGLHLKS